MRQIKIIGMLNKDCIKTFASVQKTEAVSLLSAVVVSGILLVAAYGKMFFPSEKLIALDFAVSIFEIILLSMLILYRNRWEMWVIAGLVFSCWGGYSLFWYQVELPCTCMGASVSIPEGFTLALDAFFYSLSLCIAFLLGAKKRWLYLSLFNGLLFGMGGYAFANLIYHRWVLA